MNRPAYDEAYLESMLQKTRYLFRLIARNCTDVFRVITEYMQSDYRRHMDEGNPLYLNKTPKQILGDLGICIQKGAEISREYDEFILEWMADIYTFMQWKYAMSSKDIVKKIRPEDLYKKYSPLHEMSVKNGVDRLIKIYDLQNEGQTAKMQEDI